MPSNAMEWKSFEDQMADHGIRVKVRHVPEAGTSIVFLKQSCPDRYRCHAGIVDDGHDPLTRLKHLARERFGLNI